MTEATPIHAAAQWIGIVSNTAIREVAVAAKRGSVTRQSLREWGVALEGNHFTLNSCEPRVSSRTLDRLYKCMDDFGMRAVVGRKTIRLVSDRAKGGWSNLCLTPEVPDASDDIHVYIARNETVARSARDADEANDHETLAGLLGIPGCCSRFFNLVWPSAQRRQGDLVPYSCAMTAEHPYPWDFRTNVAAQYFGLAPISFFPCSFLCNAAAEVGAAGLSVVSEIWGDSVHLESIRSAKAATLYTEYEGIARWTSSTFENQTLQWPQGAIEVSDPSAPLAALLMETICLSVRSPHAVALATPSGLRIIEGPDVAFCIF
jgi:hypothetical protein